MFRPNREALDVGTECATTRMCQMLVPAEHRKPLKLTETLWQIPWQLGRAADWEGAKDP